MNILQYPKRLIEVDLPIKRISAHARREKSIRHGHISTLHIWWARRPLAACRAVICAALWPDPADELCPQPFRDEAVKIITEFAKAAVQEADLDKKRRKLCSEFSWNNWVKIFNDDTTLSPIDPKDLKRLRYILLDFIADFSAWENSTETIYLQAARQLTQAAHEALGGAPGTRPLVVDPFAGGGSIPLEALRVGADAFASDLNPVAVLLNKVVLEYIPKYGQRLADEVRQWGHWVKEQAEKELSEFYPKDPDGATPIAYLWARTIQCEGPGCGAEVPLMRSLWLAKKSNRSIALQFIPNQENKRVDFAIIKKEGKDWIYQDNQKLKIQNPKLDGTVKRGSATCPVCGYTTPVASVRRQLKERHGGAADARLFCVVTIRPHQQGRFYRLPRDYDLEAVRKAAAELEKRKKEHQGELSLVPDEPTPSPNGHRAVSSCHLYGLEKWGDLFTPRQALALTTLVRLIRENNELEIGTKTCLALAINRQANTQTSLSRWNVVGEKIEGLFSRQAIPMVWDYCECNFMSESTGSFNGALEWVIKVCEGNNFSKYEGSSQKHSATANPLPDDSAKCFFTDPPYYDAVPYADLSDFFYVWLRRIFTNSYSDLFKDSLTPKKEQAVVLHPFKIDEKRDFENKMRLSMTEGRRVLCPSGIGVVVFAHKSTTGWEAQIQSMLAAGWTITASWPIDTEMGSRMNAMGTASLASSIHLVCRPRENPDGSLRMDDIGDWRDVLNELPKRIHDWMPRLADEGIVGADAIFACLGPALEIFSRYSRVEKASGEEITLKEYLEHVWAAVSREALNMIFQGADATGFEEDARLTAMWLWTLSTKTKSDSEILILNSGLKDEDEADQEEDEDEEIQNSKSKIQNFSSVFSLEFDAARKIAQGLGAHLEQLVHLVEVKGDKARLLSISERAEYLLSVKGVQTQMKAKKKKKEESAFFDVFEQKETTQEAASFGDFEISSGKTVLDRIHQSALLFAAGRSEALKRFLVDDGIGNDERFWRLAQALSALYPPGADEKRWIDGVMAKKKNFGF